MLKFIDNFLNKITMYRLTLYCVISLWLLAFIFSLFGVLGYEPVNLIRTLALIFIICFLTNKLFAKVYQAPSNIESVYITVFILASIISPIRSQKDLSFLIVASILAMAGKYIFAIRRKHIFNPAALGVMAAALIINKSAVWWMGTMAMAPFVLITGILISRKLRKFDLFFSFVASSFIFIIGYGYFTGQELASVAKAIIFGSPVLYLASIMLTEPMTTPPTRNLRIAYGFFVGFLNAPFVNVAKFYFTPEIALVVGNFFSYIAGPKGKFILKLKEKNKIANNIYNFIFTSNKKIKFKPGQYLEWTLPHEKIDNRGMRRYFTIASSPTEENLIMGVKFYEKPSSYKQSLITLEENGTIIASQLAGDFTLPKDKNEKLVFIAGGIGITPFRSMIKYLIDTNEKRNIIIFYSCKTAQDIAYKEIFEEAGQKFGIKIIYSITDIDGVINQKIIKKNTPDFLERTFYISGPISMITTFQKALKDAGVHKSQIKTDFFPGFA